MGHPIARRCVIRAREETVLGAQGICETAQGEPCGSGRSHIMGFSDCNTFSGSAQLPTKLWYTTKNLPASLLAAGEFHEGGLRLGEVVEHSLLRTELACMCVCPAVSPVQAELLMQ